MASVSRCDACGAIVNHDDCMIIKMFEETTLGTTRKMKYLIEVCPNCTQKILEMCGYGSEQRETV